jgi:lysophospholipase L1-like esterase
MTWQKVAGLRGPRGWSVNSARVDASGRLSIGLTDGQQINAGPVVGPPGLPGVNAVSNDAANATLVQTERSAMRGALDGQYGSGAVAREALAAGRRLKAVLSGNLTEGAAGVTVAPISKLAGTSPVSLGTATLATGSNVITSSSSHGLSVGDAVSFGTMSGSIGVNAGDVYFVISAPSSTTFTVSGSPGGGARTITADGSSVAIYRRELAYNRTLSKVHPALRISETRAVQANANFPRWDYISADPTVITTGTGTGTYTNMRVETEYSGDRLGLLLRNTGSLIGTVLVDGRIAGSFKSADLTAAGVPSGELGRFTLSFSTKRRRTITILFDGLSEFGGFDLQPAYDLIFPTSTSKGARVLFAGDSFTEGTGSGSSWSYVRWVSLLMGWGDVWKGGSGGTGYVKALDGGRPALISRYQNDIIAQQPQIVVVAMGLNDQTSYEADPNSVLNAAATIWDTVLASSTVKELVVIGPWPNGGGTGVVPSLIDMDAKLSAMAVARHVRYVSPIGEGWTFTRADATHPDPAGHEYLAWRLAGHLAVPYTAA